MLTRRDLVSIRRSVQRLVSETESNLVDLSSDFAAGRLSLEEWQRKFTATLRMAHATATAAAYPDTVDYPDEIASTLSTLVDRQLEFLANFASDIQSGAQSLDATFLRRSMLYAGAVRGTLEHFLQKRHEQDGYNWERRVLSNAEHCPDCVHYASMGWVPIGTLPGIGIDCQCVSNCKCRKEYAVGEAPPGAFGGKGSGIRGHRTPKQEKASRKADEDAKCKAVGISRQVFVGMNAKLKEVMDDYLTSSFCVFPRQYDEVLRDYDCSPTTPIGTQLPIIDHPDKITKAHIDSLTAQALLYIEGDEPITDPAKKVVALDIATTAVNRVLDKTSFSASFTSGKLATNDVVTDPPPAPTGPLPTPKPERKFSTTQFNLPDSIADSVRRFALSIPDSELAKDGREDKPHITLRYGLHTDTADDLVSILSEQPPVTVQLGPISVFTATEERPFDVVKIEVFSEALTRLNNLVVKQTEGTDTHQTYNPHVTVAYVQPGMGNKYIGPCPLSGTQMTFDEVIFSNRRREQTRIPLRKGVLFGGVGSGIRGHTTPKPFHDHFRQHMLDELELYGIDKDAAQGMVDRALKRAHKDTSARQSPLDTTPVVNPSPAPVSPPVTSEKMLSAFDQLDRDRGGHNLVNLVKLRAAVGGSREAFDNQLYALRKERKLTLSAAEGRHGLSEEERAAGIVQDGVLLLYVSRVNSGRFAVGFAFDESKVRRLKGRFAPKDGGGDAANKTPSKEEIEKAREENRKRIEEMRRKRDEDRQKVDTLMASIGMGRGLYNRTVEYSRQRLDSLQTIPEYIHPNIADYARIECDIHFEPDQVIPVIKNIDDISPEQYDSLLLDAILMIDSEIHPDGDYNPNNNINGQEIRSRIKQIADMAVSQSLGYGSFSNGSNNTDSVGAFGGKGSGIKGHTTPKKNDGKSAEQRAHELLESEMKDAGVDWEKFNKTYEEVDRMFLSWSNPLTNYTVNNSISDRMRDYGFSVPVGTNIGPVVHPDDITPAHVDYLTFTAMREMLYDSTTRPKGLSASDPKWIKWLGKIRSVSETIANRVLDAAKFSASFGGVGSGVKGHTTSHASSTSNHSDISPSPKADPAQPDKSSSTNPSAPSTKPASLLPKTSKKVSPYSFEHHLQVAQTILDKFKSAYGKVIANPAFKAVKAASSWCKAKSDAVYKSLEKRYGKKSAIAILASAQVVGWGALGVGAAVGIPLYLPGVSIWGTLPAVALAETMKQAHAGISAAKQAVGFNEDELPKEKIAYEANQLVRHFEHFYLEWMNQNADAIAKEEEQVSVLANLPQEEKEGEKEKERDKASFGGKGSGIRGHTTPKGRPFTDADVTAMYHKIQENVCGDYFNQEKMEKVNREYVEMFAQEFEDRYTQVNPEFVDAIYKYIKDSL